MTQDLPSIEDLLPAKKPATANSATTNPSITDVFQEKMAGIQLTEKERLTKTDAESAGRAYIDLSNFAVSPEALSLIPEAEARRLKVVAFLWSGTEIRLGAIDPANQEIVELAYQLGERNQAKTAVYQITEHSLERALALYAALPQVKTVVKGVKITDEEMTRYRALIKDFEAVQKLLATASTTDVLTVIISAALELGSSDVHVEAEESGIKFRLRIDGFLQDAASLPNEAWKKIISRIKLIAGLKLNITDRPQDGRFTIFLQNEKIDVRTSTLPTAYGESVVMRLLRSSAVTLDLETLGLRPPVFEKLRREIEKPHGMVITTGPTGSGKTTTLYAVLLKLNKKESKIITLEDPIEYKVEGLNQSQIDHEKDYTFAKGLRSILRQDPDIVMVGEIRDLETAEIAIQAALTGHLMLSTIHTNDAAGALPRFLSMGVKPFLLAPALNAIVGQRLIRKIHSDCKEEVTLSAEVLEKVKEILSQIPPNSGETVNQNALKFFHGKGCDGCHMSGYKGRLGIYELLQMTPDVQQVVLAGAVSEYQMRELAQKQGMVTMVQDGLLKALDGITSVEEVFRVAQE